MALRRPSLTLFCLAALQGALHAGPDEGLLWSTFLGGSASDEAVHDVAVRADGSVVVVGATESADFPTTPGVLGPGPGGNVDGFISAFDADGRLIFSTYLGGDGADWLETLAVLDNGDIVVGGRTTSTDIDLGAGGFQPVKNGTSDAFLAIVRGDGSAILAASYFGGPTSDPSSGPADIDIAPDGSIVFMGRTTDPDLPLTPGALDTEFSESEVYVAKASPRLDELQFATFLGGTGGEKAGGLAVDGRTGHLLVVGTTASTDFPTTPGAYLEEPPESVGGENNGFVIRLTAEGDGVVAATFLGGSDLDDMKSVSLAPNGDVIALGSTRSSDFPATPGAFDTEYAGCILCGPDATVTRLTPDLSALVYSTFLGGFGFEDAVLDMTLDAAGAPIITGKTTSFDYPTTPGALGARLKAGNDEAFVTKLHQDGDRLVYSTYLGGILNELFLTSDAPAAGTREGAVVVGGNTSSPDFPVTPGAFQSELDLPDGFVSCLTLLAKGVTRVGTATSACAGDPIIGAISMPRVGSDDFELTCWNAPPRATGYLLLAEQGLAEPAVVSGAGMWVDPGSLLAVAAPQADEVGYVELRIAIPDDPVLEGAVFQAQFFWPDACAAAGLSGSPALEVVVQP